VETPTNCGNCGSAVVPGAAFCASCGTSLKLQPPPEQNQTWWQGQQPQAAEETAQPPVSEAQPVPAPIAAPAIPSTATQSPQMGATPTAAGNLSLSDIITALGFIGVLIVFFALPFGKNGFGQNVSATDELGRVSDYASITGTANIIYTLWAVPALAGLGLAIQLLTLANSQGRQRSRSTVWCGVLIIVALFVSSAGYAALYSEVQNAFGSAGGQSSTEVFFWPITGIGKDAPGYTMLTACAVVAVVSGLVGGSSSRGS
jgi:hypothetical protein